MKFHHLGIACADITDALAYLKNIYRIRNISDIYYDPNQKAKVCLIDTSDNISIELVSGKNTENFLKKNVYLYHMCYEVSDIGKTVRKFIQAGNIQISPPKKAVLFNGKRVAFIYTRIGIIELLEK